MQSVSLNLTITDRREAEWWLDVDRTRFTHLISIYGHGNGRPCSGFDEFEGKKLACQFDDVPEDLPRFGYIAPTREDVTKIVEFCKVVPENARVLIHCEAGISRSTAAGYVLLCTMRGPGREVECILDIYAIRPEAAPNMRVVDFADEILERNGRMNHARIAFTRVAPLYGFGK